MNAIKRILALLLVCAMLLLTVACEKTEPANSDSSTTTEAIDDENLFDEPVADNSEENTTVGDSDNTTSTTEKATKKNTSKNNSTKPTKPTETTTKPQNDTDKITVSKAEYSWDSVKQIVYYPQNIKESNKTYPVIVWANGTMCPPEMYDGLLKAIAEGGYVVIANAETMAADGTAQRASIDFILSENNSDSSLFYKKIDKNNIGAAGHSQGGRSSVNAAVADERIECVLSLAGSNYDYEAEPLSTPTFFVAGSSDMVVDAGMWIEPAYEICKGPAVYASLDGAIHTRCCTNPSDYSGYAIEWFDAWLKNDADALKTFRDGGALSKDNDWKDFACKGF